MATRDELVGYDVSPDAYELKALCPRCGRMPTAPVGAALFAGEEWGAYEPPTCERCGVEIEGLELVDPS